LLSPGISDKILLYRGIFVFDVLLFLGLPVDPSFQKMLENIDSRMLKIYISDSEESYLKQVSFEGKKYIGKFAGPIANVAELPSLENNIWSILSKLFPEDSLKRVSLSILAVSTPN
jgi:hypothetical protein